MAAETVTPALLRDWPLPPPGESTSDRGSALVVGGAERSPGAALLAGIAALRSGAGRLQLAVARPVAAAVAVAAPEALVVPLPHDPRTGSIEPEAADLVADLVSAADVVCLGPGLDDLERSADLLGRLCGHGPRTAVLDAYALGALAQRPECAGGLGGGLVLTPNASEAAHLLGGEDEAARLGDDRAAAAAEIARRYTAVVSLRGTLAAPDGRAWLVGHGGPGLGTSGSGDVLAGVVAGLLARGAEPAQAAVWGTYLHAAAGDRLAARVGAIGYLARELLDDVPLVLAELRKPS